MVFFQEFEDLDEIIVRYIQLMVVFVRDVMNFKYYKELDGGKREILEKIFLEEKKKGFFR